MPDPPRPDPRVEPPATTLRPAGLTPEQVEGFGGILSLPDEPPHDLTTTERVGVLEGEMAELKGRVNALERRGGDAVIAGVQSELRKLREENKDYDKGLRDELKKIGDNIDKIEEDVKALDVDRITRVGKQDAINRRLERHARWSTRALLGLKPLPVIGWGFALYIITHLNQIIGAIAAQLHKIGGP
jgi:hypothetical protein